MNNNNAQQLNITTILNNDKINDYNNYNNENIMLMNNIFNNTKNKNKYEIKQYLGEGIQGSLYMAYDKNNKKYICKKNYINQTINPNQKNQLIFELNLLKYLSTNKNTREYINPCIEYKFIDNNIFTIFPIFNGYSLNHLKKYLLDMKNKNYYKLIFHLIKVILHGLAKIHQHNVAHQNINENSILVSTYTNNDEIKVKFTDFGLGCGVQNNYLTKMSYNLNNCKNNITEYPMQSPMQNPIKITNNIIKELSTTDYLSIAQKTDIINLCTIFIQLLLFFEKIEFNLSKGYNNTIKEQIKTIVTNKFLSQIEKYRKKKSSDDYDSLLLINTNHETKRDILEYLNIFNNFILCEDKNMKDCQYILDKLIIYEKYKNEVF